MAKLEFDQLLRRCTFRPLEKKMESCNGSYIFMERNGIHIIDLYKTIAKAEEAAEALKKIAKSGKKILFVAKEASQACCRGKSAEREYALRN